MRAILSGVERAGSDKALLTEFCGSDASARFIDASLAQGKCLDVPLVAQMDIYGISPFRYVFPEVKLIEWNYTQKDYHRITRRMLFNGIGVSVSEVTTDQLAELTRFAEAMRSVGDVLGSQDCEPLVPTLVENVNANRFSLNGREVYTLWNQTGGDVSGCLVKIRGAADRRFVDLFTGKELRSTKVSGGAEIELALPKDEVAIIGVFPKVIKKSGDNFACPNGIELQNGGGFVRAVKNGYLVQDIVQH